MSDQRCNVWELVVGGAESAQLGLHVVSNRLSSPLAPTALTVNFELVPDRSR
jgi:hypothetical protein